MAYSLGGTVAAATEATAREYGKTLTEFDTDCSIFQGLPASSVTWMSHGDYISQVPDGFAVTAKPLSARLQQWPARRKALWRAVPPGSAAHRRGQRNAPPVPLYRLRRVRRLDDGRLPADRDPLYSGKVGSGRALLALSGGVDSSVAAALMAEAIGSQLTCVFVDHGLMRKMRATK